MTNARIEIQDAIAIDHDIILLSESDFVYDSARNRVELYEGAKVKLQENDLVADGTIIPKPDGCTLESGKWFVLLDHAFIPLAKYQERYGAS